MLSVILPYNKIKNYSIIKINKIMEKKSTIIIKRNKITKTQTIQQLSS